MQKKILDFKTKSEALFTELKNEILNGNIKPGEPLNQVNLSKIYNVSRIPARDAIKRLEAIGLVKLEKNRAIVKPINLQEFIEIYKIRIILEDYAIRKSLPKLDEKKLIILSNILESMEEIIEVEEWVMMDREFHLKVYDFSGIEILLEIITNLYNSTNYSRLKILEKPGRIKIGNDAHRTLFRALERKDLKECRKLIKRHIKESIDRIINDKNNKF